MKHSRLTWLVGAAGVAVVAAGATVATEVYNHDDAPRQRPAAATTATGEPLDEIYGLGVSREAEERDDTIAFYEAWKRDAHTAQCMRAAGFTWHPEALFPAEEVSDIARALGVTPATGPLGADAPTKNRRIESALTPDRRDAYFRTLLAESAAAIDRMRETGGLPSGQDGERFATGGCVGQASAAVGSIWNLERQLGDDLQQLRARARETKAFGDARRAYAACASAHGLDGVRDPGDIERLDLTDPETAGAFSAVEAECQHLWDDANDQGLRAVAEEFRTEYADVIEQQQNRYAGMLDRVRSDESFRTFLAEQAGRAQATAPAPQ